MLQVITLYTIQKIFEFEVYEQLRPMTKMCYINTLIYYFDGKPATVENCVAFDILFNEIKDLNSAMKYYTEMEAAGLVKINQSSITFRNKWFKHMDKTQLNKVKPEEYLVTMGSRPAKEFEAELLSRGSAFDLLGMRHKLSHEQITGLIKEFIMEQDAKGKMYGSDTEFTSHCINWFNKKVQFMPKNTGKGTGKLLGL